MQPPRVVVAIPALNEEKRIENVIRLCLQFVPDVWIIDDGSIDRTAESARQSGARVIGHSKNEGKGMAIRTALNEFKKSDHDYLLLMDADGQHDPASIPDFIRCAISEKADVIMGNRMEDTSKMPLVRRYTNLFMSSVISRISRRQIPDSQCGFRMLSRHFAEQFKPTTFRFDLESEMLIQAGRLGMKIPSIPISTIYSGQTSHIHPIKDTIRFLKLIKKYSAFPE
jgi:glycosyltransferase involved in cell wall biosynthesis